MSVYKLDKLMDETRRLASEFRRSTGKALPVCSELARYDATRILGLSTPTQAERAVDACMQTADGIKKVQIKSRAVFDQAKSGQRIGQLSLDANWDMLLLVIMNSDYETCEIYSLSREKLMLAIADPNGLKKNPRGAMSVKKFKAIAELCWQAQRA